SKGRFRFACVDTSLPTISIASGLGHSLAICKNTSSEDETSVVTWDGTRALNLGETGLRIFGSS
ncbi:rcc1 and btb domain-containing protein 2, partial [Phtheirospermum japonicum]